jgi:hypothetical protein
MDKRSTTISVCLILLSIGVAVAGSALAQGMMGGGTGQGMTGMMQGGTDQGMMRGGMMGRGMMQGNPGEICPMMGGMMDGRMSAGMSGLFGSRVVPKMNLSADDVRGYLTAQIDRLGNKRLKVGSVNADAGNIIAEVVTVDNSLVQRMKVDRSTGNIEYEN